MRVIFVDSCFCFFFKKNINNENEYERKKKTTIKIYQITIGCKLETKPEAFVLTFVFINKIFFQIQDIGMIQFLMNARLIGNLVFWSQTNRINAPKHKNRCGRRRDTDLENENFKFNIN